MQKVIGNCGKHPGQSMINCPLCAIEEQKKLIAKKYHAVEYAGYWHIQDQPYYGGKDLLNAEDVGVEEAAKNANMIESLLNSCTCDKKEMIESAFRRAYSLGYEAASIGENLYVSECWQAFKTENNL